MSDSCITRFNFLLCFGVFLLLLGCSKEPEAHSIVNVGDQFEIKLSQVLSVKGGIPAIQINSLEPQDCTNAYISHQAVITEDKIEITINDILIEGNCIPGSGIISEEILLNTPKTASPIEILLKDAIANYGTFYSDNAEIEIIFSQFDGLKITKTHLNKILPKMMWGSFSLSNDDIFNQLNESLQNLDNGSTKLKGDYGHYYLSHDNNVIVYGDEDEFEFSFLISTEEEFKNIKAIFQEFKEQDESLILKATNYNGSSINIQ